jgi:hypothetical protein
MAQAVENKTPEERLARWDAEHRGEPWFEDWVRLRTMLSDGRVPEAREYSKELAAKWPGST